MPQLSRLPAPQAILEKLCHSSPGCRLPRPYSKNYATALQAVGSPDYTRKIMSQLSRLPASQAILEKLCHSSPGCRLSRPYSNILNYTSALGAGVSKTDLRYPWSHVLVKVGNIDYMIIKLQRNKETNKINKPQ